MAHLSGWTKTRAARRILLIGVCVAALTAAYTPAAWAAGRSGCESVHVGPQIAPGAPPSSYFQLTLQPGTSTRAAVIAANPEPYSCQIDLVAAYGKTALNSGDTYPVTRPAGAGCVSTSCWLSGLPRTITVPAKRRTLVPFTVSVPNGTPGGQYLGGVVSSPGTPPAPPTVSAGHSQVGASVVARVAMGVAVTVPGTLAPKLTIPSVRIDTSDRAAVLHVAERDLGNTWEHPEGQVLVTTAEPFQPLAVAFLTDAVSRPVTFPVVHRFGIKSATILAGDSASLPLAVGEIPRGTWPTEVRLWYDHHRKLAVWRGQVGFPEPATGEGATQGNHPTTSPMQLPLWATILIGGLAAVSLALGGLLLLLLRKRRHREAAA